jgi:hypothetical protein
LQRAETSAVVNLGLAWDGELVIGLQLGGQVKAAIAHL